MSGLQVVSREDWLLARKELLAKEKQLTDARDEVSAARRALPMTRVEKDYRFQASSGEQSLHDLF